MALEAQVRKKDLKAERIFTYLVPTSRRFQKKPTTMFWNTCVSELICWPETIPLTIFRSPDDSGDARLTVSYIGQREEQGGRNGN